MKHRYVIKTNRLLLCQVTPNDLEYIRAWRNDVNIRKFFFDSNIISKEQQINWYNEYLNNEKDIMFIVKDLRGNNGPIGTVALYNVNTEDKTAEFGRLIIGNFEARRKGFGTECVQGICEFGFNQLGLEKIFLEVFKNNITAVKAYKSVGFEVEKEYIKNNKSVLRMELEK